MLATGFEAAASLCGFGAAAAGLGAGIVVMLARLPATKAVMGGPGSWVLPTSLVNANN
jgi:hypothetical protein